MDIPLDRFDYLMDARPAHRGRDVRTGLDCYGLVMHVYEALGRPIPDYLYPDESGAKGALIAERYHELWEKAEAPEPGDVVLMRVGPFSLPSHVGVYLGGWQGVVLHMTDSGAMKTPIRRLDVKGIYRLK